MTAHSERFGFILEPTQVLMNEFLACVRTEMSAVPTSTITNSTASSIRQAELDGKIGRWRDDYLELSPEMVTKTLVKSPRGL